MTDHKVVIIGGGAGGLELAARLGRTFGPSHVYLIDRDDSHIWKPSLHEVAAGTLDIHREGLSYMMLAKERNFTFVLGNVQHIDCDTQRVAIQPYHSAQGHLIFESRELHYDTLIIAVGSKSNFFGTPGAAEHAIALDSTAEAERFRQQMLHELARVARTRQADRPEPVLRIGIVGGGATGVELAAELLEAVDSLAFYGTSDLDPNQNLEITLLEGSDRILSALPERMSAAAQKLLLDRGINVKTSVRVARVEADAMVDTDGNSYPVTLCVWAAGIEAPAFLSQLGLETNRIHQIIVDEHLRSTRAAVYAMGDCAQAPWVSYEGSLPARAQVAHQQATYLYKVVAARIRHAPVPDKPFRFKDYGSLVAVGHSRGVGSLMGVLAGKSWFVEGLLARMMYMSLHLMHHMAVLGIWRTASLALGRLLLKRSTPRVKLH